MAQRGHLSTGGRAAAFEPACGLRTNQRRWKKSKRCRCRTRAGRGKPSSRIGQEAAAAGTNHPGRPAVSCCTARAQPGKTNWRTGGDWRHHHARNDQYRPLGGCADRKITRCWTSSLQHGVTGGVLNRDAQKELDAGFYISKTYVNVNTVHLTEMRFRVVAPPELARTHCQLWRQRTGKTALGGRV